MVVPTAAPRIAHYRISNQRPLFKQGGGTCSAWAVPPPLTTKHPLMRSRCLWLTHERAKAARASIAGVGPPPPWPQAETAQDACGELDSRTPRM